MDLTEMVDWSGDVIQPSANDDADAGSSLRVFEMLARARAGVGSEEDNRLAEVARRMAERQKSPEGWADNFVTDMFAFASRVDDLLTGSNHPLGIDGNLFLFNVLRQAFGEEPISRPPLETRDDVYDRSLYSDDPEETKERKRLTCMFKAAILISSEHEPDMADDLRNFEAMLKRELDRVPGHSPYVDGKLVPLDVDEFTRLAKRYGESVVLVSKVIRNDAVPKP